jgi:transcriptional regulator with XRE-family HTH domain
MNVDAQRIRLERERRAWTQAQLAGATGLGLRTVQRIEREGSASFESAQAIAAALELTIADLRIESVPTPSLRIRGLPLMRLACAAVSGIALWFWLDWSGGPYLYDEGRFWVTTMHYLVSGGLFAMGVLIPELRAGRGFVRRALGLVLASAASFFVAVTLTFRGADWFGLHGNGWDPSIYSVLLASVAGAAIVLVATGWLIGADRPLRLWAAGMAAAVLGGVAVHGGFLFASLEFLSFACWHMLLCLAIRVGRGMDMPIPTLRPLIRSARAVLPGGRLWRERATQT